jgi:hypothetical protein
MMYRAVCLLWVGALTIGLMSSIQALAQDLDSQDGAGAVFVMTNSVKNNEVIAYRRAVDGTLREENRFAIANTGALTALPGTVVGTNPAGSTNLDIAVTADGKFVYTLNSVAGSVGIFAVQNDGTLLNVGSAGGVSPLSGFNGIAGF